MVVPFLALRNAPVLVLALFRHRFRGLCALAALVVLCAGLLLSNAPSQRAGTSGAPAGSTGAQALPAPQAPIGGSNNPVIGASSSDPLHVMRPSTGTSKVVVVHDTKHDISPPLRDVKPLVPSATGQEAPENPLQGGRDTSSGTNIKDPVVQKSVGPFTMPDPIQNFNALSNADNGNRRIAPPDTQGDVGPNHYVQWVNSVFAIYNKQGTKLYGPAAGNTLWTGFGGMCETNNNGDPVTLYDSIADRWLMSQFAVSQGGGGPSYECIAISSSPDPMGTYYRYGFLVSNTQFYDYPKFGLWPDAYYMTDNVFENSAFVGNANFAFDRTRMLAGQPATFQVFTTNYGGLMPSHLTGPTLPPDGEPNFFATVNTPDNFLLWKFHVDWTTPANSTFTGPTVLTTAAFSDTLCGAQRQQCVPQPGTANMLESLTHQIMHRFTYRNMGSYETLLSNHSVSADTQEGIRWEEIRDPNGAPSIFQQGTYAPADGVYRWVGSIAMDHTGNIALGFSASSSTLFPSIRYTGRLVSDPPGTLPQGEGSFQEGGGSETDNHRWGDYSTMSIDPADDCTFWFTSEYFPVTSGREWSTKVSSFKFPNCKSGAAPTATPPPVTATPFPGQCLIQFADVPSSNTFYNYVRCLACHNIVSGYTCGGTNPETDAAEPCNAYNNAYFRYNNHITRGQISKLVSLSAAINDDPGPQVFEDVPGTSPFYAYVNRLANRNFMGGYVCGGPDEPCGPENRPYFRPGRNASRGQLSKIVSNTVGYSEPHTEVTFSDVQTDSPFYLPVQRLASRGAMSGYGCGGINPETGVAEPCDEANRSYFRPGNTVTRGQASKIDANTFFPNCQTPASR
ncbi:MAG: S-layer homology domain-containing protein [Chloroflexota bacterium]|nr:S-layer homology domain-containing protein [Chloroflexota bacterium]